MESDADTENVQNENKQFFFTKNDLKEFGRSFLNVQLETLC
jgi:hypothetical protein